MATWVLLLGALMSSASAVWGCDPEQFRCGDGSCISATWVCDGGTECRDGSDEEPEMCRSLPCPLQHFDCGVSVGRQRCVPMSWRCDGQQDCGHGQDEMGCTPPPCPPAHFRCPSGSCVSPSFLCDGDRDCPDGADERSCPSPPPCPPASFRCTDGACVHPTWLCDGDADCTDGSDEWRPPCPEVTEPLPHNLTSGSGGTSGSGSERCPPLTVPCRSGGCVLRTWRCDGTEDCGDGSDEEGCAPPPCPPEDFRCADGRCVGGAQRCDGHRDCGDGGDEDGCQNATCSGPSWFRCRSGQCIHWEQLCDGRRHCQDWSDEPIKLCGVDECREGSAGCSHICQDLPIGFRCLCPDGFRLGADGKSCEDIDECWEWERCAQRCINLQGAFKCECAQGYEAEPDGRGCRAVAPGLALLLWSRHTLRLITGGSLGSMGPILNSGGSNVSSRVSGGSWGRRSIEWLRGDFPHGAVADVDVAEGNIYWADPTQRRLFRAPLSPPGAPPTPLQPLGGVPSALALDWVHHNVYWGDPAGGALKVLPVGGGSGGALSATIWQRNGSQPRGIALDPMMGFLFWSDCGSLPFLGRVGLNGADPKVLLDRGLRCPTAITLDPPSGRLYWLDVELHTLSTVSLWGGQRRTLLEDPKWIQSPSGIAAFEGRLFWTDSHLGSLFSAPRRSEVELHRVAESLPGVGGVLVLHPLRQPPGHSVCSPSNGGCSALCLPSPHTEPYSTPYNTAPHSAPYSSAPHSAPYSSAPHSAPYSCACSDGQRLADDGRHCLTDPTAPTPTGPNSTTATVQPHSAAGTHSNGTHSNGTHSNNGTHINGTNSTALRADAVGPSIGPPSMGPPSMGPSSMGPPSIGPSMGPPSIGPSSMGPKSGLVALAVLLPLALLGGLWGLRGLRRWWRRRSSNSISFGNPLFLKEPGEHQWQRLDGDGAQSGDSGL